MKTFDELRKIAKDYASEKKNNDVILYEPIFRIENDILCLAYLIIDFNDEFNNDYRIKRPVEWLIQDIKNGEILEYNNIKNKDYSTTSDLPLNMLFDNNGDSILYDNINLITRSFQQWQKDTLKNLYGNINYESNLLYEEKVMKINNELFSPKDYILANIESSFDKMFNILFNDMGNAITESFNEYSCSLFESIRKKYETNNQIDKDLIKQYMNCIKYSYPESLELFNKSTNITDVCDSEYDNAILEMLKSKNTNNSKLEDA